MQNLLGLLIQTGSTNIELQNLIEENDESATYKTSDGLVVQISTNVN